MGIPKSRLGLAISQPEPVGCNIEKAHHRKTSIKLVPCLFRPEAAGAVRTTGGIVRMGRHHGTLSGFPPSQSDSPGWQLRVCNVCGRNLQCGGSALSSQLLKSSLYCLSIEINVVGVCFVSFPQEPTR